MVGLGDKNGDTFDFGGVEQFPVQLKVTFECFQVFTDFLDIFGIGFKNGPQEKCFDVLCRMLLQVHDVCASLGEYLSGSGNKSLLVGAMNLQNVTSNSHSPKL